MKNLFIAVFAISLCSFSSIDSEEVKSEMDCGYEVVAVIQIGMCNAFTNQKMVKIVEEWKCDSVYPDRRPYKVTVKRVSCNTPTIPIKR